MIYIYIYNQAQLKLIPSAKLIANERKSVKIFFLQRIGRHPLSQWQKRNLISECFRMQFKLIDFAPTNCKCAFKINNKMTVATLKNIMSNLKKTQRDSLRLKEKEKERKKSTSAFEITINVKP